MLALGASKHGCQTKNSPLSLGQQATDGVGMYAARHIDDFIRGYHLLTALVWGAESVAEVGVETCQFLPTVHLGSTAQMPRSQSVAAIVFYTPISGCNGREGIGTYGIASLRGIHVAEGYDVSPGDAIIACLKHTYVGTRNEAIALKTWF